MIDYVISNISICSFEDVSFIVNFLTMMSFSAKLLIFLFVSWIYFLTSFAYFFVPSLKSWIVWKAEFELFGISTFFMSLDWSLRSNTLLEVSHCLFLLMFLKLLCFSLHICWLGHLSCFYLWVVSFITIHLGFNLQQHQERRNQSLTEHCTFSG